MLKFLRKQRADLLEQRATQKSLVDSVLDPAVKEGRGLTPEESTKYQEARAKLVATDEELVEVEARIADAEADEAREAQIADIRKQAGVAETRSESTFVVTKDEGVYRRFTDHQGHTVADPNGPSYFRDLVTAQLGLEGRAKAQERLAINARAAANEAKETRALTTTDGAGGDMVPPLWMVNEYIQLARAARPLADRVRNMALPKGTDSLNIPRIATGTAVAEQAIQNTAVQNTDATTGAISAAVTTLAGQQVIAVQLIEQSPLNMDDILLADLALDYAQKVDVFCLSNNVAGKRGLLNVTGTNAVTLSTTGFAALYPKLADATQQVYTQRFLPPDTILMHPRRWASLLGSLDTQNRPLVLPGGGAELNALASSNGLTAQGVAGSIMGVPVVLDPNIPTNMGAGTNQDPILVFRAQDSILWEGAANAEAFRETKADQLSVLLRFYRYVAFTGERYAKSISVINGTGLVAPTF